MDTVGQLSREELLIIVCRQDQRLATQDEHITTLSHQLAELVEANQGLVEANQGLAAKLARAEHLLTRNSHNSSMPPSTDERPGQTPPARTPHTGPRRAKGKRPGAPGTHLRWTDNPDLRRDQFPHGRCDCGNDLAAAADVGIVDRYQQHEIPQIGVQIIQYDQHQVQCRCGTRHIAARPDGARSGPVGYGPNLAAFAVYLMVAHFIPAHRVVALLESLTGAAPSVGFVHGMLGRTAGLLAETHQRIRTLITRAYVVCCDETPLRVGPRLAPAGKKKAERYLLVACTQLYTHYLLGDRSLATFKAFVLAELSGSVIVHDRYQNYDSTELGTLIHQLCTAHLLRDLEAAAQTYPEAIWPIQIAEALRELIHHTNLARAQGHDMIPIDVRDELLTRFHNGVLVGLSDTTSHGDRPGERKARLLLEVLRDRPHDVLRFAHDLAVPPTSNQAERDLRPSKIQQKISGRLTSEKRTQDRYTILGYLSTAAKHGLDKITVLRDALTGRPWTPPLPAPT